MVLNWKRIKLKGWFWLMYSYRQSLDLWGLELNYPSHKKKYLSQRFNIEKDTHFS